MPLERRFDLVGVVVTDRAVDRAGGRFAVIADVLAVAHPVLVPNRLVGRVGADLPHLARVQVEAPDAVLHQMPRPFVAERDDVRQLGRGVEVTEPVVLRIDQFGFAAIDRNFHNQRMRMRLPRLAEANVAVAQVHHKAVGKVLRVPRAEVLPVGGGVGAAAHVALRAREERARLQRRQIERRQDAVLREVDFLAGRIFAQAAGFAQRRIKVGELRDLAALQIHAEEVRAVPPVGVEDDLAPVVVPAGVREVEMIAVPLVIRILAYRHPADRVRVHRQLGFPT